MKNWARETFLIDPRMKMDTTPAVILVGSTLILVFGLYHTNLLPVRSLSNLVSYLGLSLLMLLILRQSPAQYGFKIGRWKIGLAYTLAGVIISTLIVLLVAQSPSFKNYYISKNGSPLPLALDSALDLFGWEFLFRGVLLFALWKICGPYALILQAVPFTLAHYGKPELETWSCIFGGTLFGYIAWKSESFFYPFLIHWYLNTLLIAAATGTPFF